MSNLLAQYANNITQSAANVSNAYAQKANAEAQAQHASAQSIGNLQNTLQAQEQNKLKAQEIQAQKEVGLAQAEQEGSFMRMLMAKDNGLDDRQIQELEDNRKAKMQEQLKANANIPITGLEVAAAGVGAIGAGAGKVGKWAWDKTKGAIANYQSKRASQSELGQKIGANFSNAPKTPTPLQPKPTQASKLQESLTRTPNMNTLIQNPKGTPKGIGSYSIAGSPLTK